MKNNWVRVAVVGSIVCCCAVGCRRTTDDPLTHGWERLDEVPLQNAPILSAAAESPCVWTVSQNTGSVSVAEEHGGTRRTRRQEVRLDTPAGTLVGTDKGEYIGSLILLGASGAPVRELIADNVFQLLPVKAGVLVITGLLHLGVERGSLWLFYKDDRSGWSIKKIADIDGYPRAAQEKSGSIMIVTAHGVSVVDQTLGVREIASLPFAQMEPNSVAEDERDRIYIGMNAFVVRLVPGKAGYIVQWFTKKGCV